MELTTEETAAINAISSLLRCSFDQISYIYQSIKIQGKAFDMDIKQFANFGIPIYQALYEIVELPPDQFRGYVRDGKVKSHQVQEVLFNLTSEGGIFHN